jgi:beta-galactosidase/beta-glucuronidase
MNFPNAHEYLQEKYSWEHMYKALDEVFNNGQYVLEIPGVYHEIYVIYRQRFENDNRKIEGSFTYPVGDQIVTRKKNNFELSSTNLYGWEDVRELFLDYTAKAYEEYGNHLKNTF